MLIIGILLFGLVVGFLAALLVPGADQRDWGTNLAAGLIGSFVGGTIGSLLAGEGFRLRPSGLIGSFIGAVIVLLVITAVRRRR